MSNAEEKSSKASADMLSKLDLPTLRQGSGERKNATE